jgi:nitrile hydratase accessory protein
VGADLTARPAPASSRQFSHHDDGPVFREPVFREPVFREPWEAQAFALAQSLKERGVFSATEWAEALGAEIKKAQAAGDPDTGETYYRHWLAALETLVAAKGLADAQKLARTREAWRRASARTPHGAPIALQPDDFND